MRHFALLCIALGALATAAVPAHGNSFSALPKVDRGLSTARSADGSCALVTGRRARGLAVARYRAPMSGFATFKLRSRRGDWDLAVVDARSRKLVGASQGFRGREVVNGWVEAGQRLAIVGCRRGGSSRRARATVELIDVAPPAGLAAIRSSLVRVYGTQQQFERLEHSGFDVTHNQTADWADVVVAGDRQRAALAKMGLRTETRIADFDAHVRRTSRADARALARRGASPLPSGRETYRSYEEIQAELKQLVTDNPGTVKPVTIGKSYQGRDLTGVEIASDVNGDDGRPVYFVMALHHAREWPSAEAAMEFAHLLAEGAGDPRIAGILKNTRTVIVPLINPDGYIASRNASLYDPADHLRNQETGEERTIPLLGRTPSFWESVAPPGGIFSYRRKNCAGGVPSPLMPCELQWGVDPNRNYGHGWGGPGSSADPTSQSYHGPGPWSEPETEAVHEYSKKRAVTTLITLHNVAALVLRPPGQHTQGLAPDEPRLKVLGDAMAGATGYTSQYGFQLYDTAGTTEDWNYAAAGTFGYTIEIGPANGAFHMPYKIGFIDEWNGKPGTPAEGKGLREALLLGAENSFDPTDHSVLVGKAPAGTTLRLEKSFTTTTAEHCKFAGGYGPFNPAFFVQFGLPEEFCIEGRKPPIEIADGLEYETRVPASGRFAWHVTPSTRPFLTVEQREERESAEPATQSFSPQRETTPWFTQDPQGAAPLDQGEPPESSIEDQAFTVAPDTSRLSLTLEFPNPVEDYDLKLFRRGDDGTLTEVDTSGNFNGQAEHIDVSRPQAGDYVLRVINYYGPSNTWGATLETWGLTYTVTPPRSETWTFSCERAGKVQHTRQVLVGRGETVDLGGNACKFKGKD